MTTKMRAVPANPRYNASLMSCLMYPMTKAMPCREVNHTDRAEAIATITYTNDC